MYKIYVSKLLLIPDTRPTNSFKNYFIPDTVRQTVRKNDRHKDRPRAAKFLAKRINYYA